MKVPLQWLEEYVDGLPPAPQLGEIFTLRGIEVEEIVTGLTGEIMVLELTPNRGDCASIIGAAREAAAALGKKVKPNSAGINENGRAIGESFSLENRVPEKCPLYFLKLIHSVESAPSPDWLKERLRDCGIRPQNNIVDITNYVLMETGQPLHAFDADKISGGEIIVREAERGEKLITLDGVKRNLRGGEVVIADPQSPLAIGGVMGGEETAVGKETERVLLEAAYFLPASVSRTESLHSLKSESSYRFARTVDREAVKPALLRAASLMEEICSSNSAPGLLKEETAPPARERVILRTENVIKCLGCEIPPEEVRGHLNSLRFDVKSKGKDFSVGVPSFRTDVMREIDLIEEIARCYGYENIPETMPEAPAEEDLLPPPDVFARAEETLRGEGFFQALTPTLFDGSQSGDIYRAGAKAVEVANPITENLNILRVDLLGGLLKAAAYNINRGNSPVKFYERGSVFSGDRDPAGEKQNLAFIQQTGDFFRLKSLATAVLDEMKQEWEFDYNAHSRWFEKERNALVYIEGKRAGSLGIIKREVLKIFGLDEEHFGGCFFDLGSFEQSTVREIKFRPWSEYPSVYRDLSVVPPDELTHSEIYGRILASGGGILKEIRLYDIYTGKGIEEGSRSMTYRLRFNSDKKTLSSREVDKKMNKIIHNLKTSLSVSLRDSG